MSLSADMQTRYQTEVDVDWYHAFILSHPSATTYYLIGNPAGEEVTALVDGVLYTFTPVPVELTPVSRDDSGRQEMGLVFGGIGLEAKDFLDAAIADGSEPVTCRYTIYIEGDQDPQIDPLIEFHLANIQIRRESVTATATRADIINRRFPTEVYTIAHYPGLHRR